MGNQHIWDLFKFLLQDFHLKELKTSSSASTGSKGPAALNKKYAVFNSASKDALKDPDNALEFPARMKIGIDGQCMVRRLPFFQEMEEEDLRGADAPRRIAEEMFWKLRDMGLAVDQQVDFVIVKCVRLR